MVIMKKRGNNENKTSKSRQNANNATEKSADVSDDDNQGFGNWLRSSTGVEMMRLFVIANSILVFVTMGWPNIKESFYILKEYFDLIMLAFAVRGVVLLSVLSWYSVTVWKMIDGYFKDQFRDYLQNEYRKYPRMRADIKNTRIVDKESVPDATPTESIPTYNRIAETYDPETTCPVDTVDACQQTIGASSGKAEESAVGENAADTVNVSSADKNAFPENAFPGQSELQSRKSSSGSDADDEERQPSAVDQNGGRENEAIKKSAASSSRRLNRKRLPKEISKERSREKPKKRRVNTIVLTDADFASVKIRRDADDDFSEFEEEEGQRVRAEEGILVSELPFKPKADIGDLDRVTAEEFCPLTLEDEASCGETTTWP